MDYFYDGQIRRYLTQFMRVMSNISYKDAKGNLVQVPVRYGDMNRQVAQILKKNSENVVQSAPFIACYIKDLQFDRERMQDPTFISKVQVRERAWDDREFIPDADGNFVDNPNYNKEYLNTQGDNYTVERIMPSPYKAVFQADIWTTNTEQKLQIWEQIVVVFNPALEIQTTDNYLDWTSLSYLELSNMQFESRTIPQGLENDISICTMNFTSPLWITPPAKVKKLGIVTKIISNILEVPSGSNLSHYSDIQLADLLAGQVVKAKTVVTPGNYSLLVLNNVATLMSANAENLEDSENLITTTGKANWKTLLDLYPGQFTAGLSQLRLIKSDGTEVVAACTLNPTDEFSMLLNVDPDTIPANTIIDGRGTIDAIINPQTFNPETPVSGVRYLILEDINVNYAAQDDDWVNDERNLTGDVYNGPVAWKNSDNTDFVAYANDIIEWSGTAWSVKFNSQNVDEETYITNSYTGTQYKWDGTQWSKSYEGVYERDAWRMVL
jgi:hypothetical protein